MTTNRTAHQDCTHEATKSARATCRKARAAEAATRAAYLSNVINAFSAKDITWLYRAARSFAQVEVTTDLEAAAAVADYFGPSGNEAQDARRRANGYTVTSDPHLMLSLTLRRHS